HAGGYADGGDAPTAESETANKDDRRERANAAARRQKSALRSQDQQRCQTQRKSRQTGGKSASQYPDRTTRIGVSCLVALPRANNRGRGDDETDDDAIGGLRKRKSWFLEISECERSSGQSDCRSQRGCGHERKQDALGALAIDGGCRAPKAD